MTRVFLLGVLTGCLLTSAAVLTGYEHERVVRAEQRLDRIEGFLGALTQMMGR